MYSYTYYRSTISVFAQAPSHIHCNKQRPVIFFYHSLKVNRFYLFVWLPCILWSASTAFSFPVDSNVIFLARLFSPPLCFEYSRPVARVALTQWANVCQTPMKSKRIVVDCHRSSCCCSIVCIVGGVWCSVAKLDRFAPLSSLLRRFGKQTSIEI